MPDREFRLSGLWPTAPDVVFTGVGLDSRRVGPGDLYVALPGARTHGAAFAAQAAAGGAVAILTDPAGAALAAAAGLPVVVVDDPREQLGLAAALVHGHPATSVAMFGVTGTNGKTSTIFLLEAALAALGEVVGTIGTIGFRLGGRTLERSRSTVTTPEAPDLQELLAVMRDGGATAVAMEVSSHALDLRRVAGMTFDVAGFTHLGRDHLDHHHDLESYFAAKARLFLGGTARTCVVNIDGSWGRRLAEQVRAEGRARLVTTGTVADADHRLVEAMPQDGGGHLVRTAGPGGERTFSVGLLGDFNVHNAITAAAMIEAAGLDVDRAVAGFATAVVPGRMQRVDLGPGAPKVVVDFAHTPEAVASALSSLPRPLIAVLGAGGDRDPGKRAPMGAVAAERADLVVVTDDNPRSEVPAAIRAAVLDGARGAPGGAEVIDGGDRRSAIALALGRADVDTWVAILGKGHESGQEIAGVTSPFDDAVVVHEEWARVAAGGTTDA